MKTIAPEVLTLLTNTNALTAILVRLEINGSDPTGLYFNRFASTNFPIYWDEGTVVEKEYIGVGDLGEISDIEETTDLSTFTVSVSLSGLPNLSQGSLYTQTMSVNYSLKPAYIYLCMLDKDTLEVVGEPLEVFSGRIDNVEISIKDTATMKVNIISRLSDWERPRGGRFTQAWQQGNVDPTDKGFQYLNQIKNININWNGDVKGDRTILSAEED
jgi:hypothetical protein